MQHIHVLQFLKRLYVKSLHSELADLTSRQMAILLTIYLDPSTRRVRHLAKELSLSKPAVTRALDRLEALHLVRRRPDEEDGRSVVVHRTTQGSWFLTLTSDIFFQANPKELPSHADHDHNVTDEAADEFASETSAPTSSPQQTEPKSQQ